jgi:predicted nucleic-acid-binding protein
VIGLDTNVLVRYIMQDDVKQAQLATKLVESLTPEAPGFVSLVTLIELVWVLSSCFDLDRTQLVRVLEMVLRTQELSVERAELVWQSVRAFADSSADFADCVIAKSAASAGCERTMTFDRLAAKSAGMTLLR